MMTTRASDLLEPDQWKQAIKHHQETLRGIVNPNLERHSKGEKHPAYDFLFEYYSFKPAQLLRWSPGYATQLRDATPEPFEHLPFFTIQKNIGQLDLKAFPLQRIKALKWISLLLSNTLEKPPRLGCLGLHEWAMVYEQQDIRHQQLPLRLPHDEVRAFLESQRITCSHYDAFRFFSQSAQPMNQFQPTRLTQQDEEQCGCLHVNMDLYKWVYKFYPWTPSNLIADLFMLAVKARMLDMKASPYDVRELGWEPIYIETESGQAEYAAQQSVIAQESIPLRKQLLDCYRGLLALVDHTPSHA